MQLNRYIKNAPEDWTIDLTPRTDQLEALAALLSWKRSADYSEVGTGKSLVSYLYIITKLLDGKKVLVIMPPPLIGQYLENFKMVKGHNYSIGVLHKVKGKRHDIMDDWDTQGWPDVLAMSYQLYVKYASSCQQYSVVVADEAHALSNVATKAYQKAFIHTYSWNADLLLMTATPCTTELKSAYGQIRLRNMQAYTSIDQFERKHCIFAANEIASGKKIKTIVAYHDIAGIQEHLMAQAVRRRAKDVLSLKELNIFNHSVYLSRDHEQLYQRLLNEWMLELGEEVIVAKNQQALRQLALQTITNPARFSEEAIDDEPLANLLAVMGSIDTSKTKVLVFCNFRDTVRKLDRELAHLNPALIYGDSNVPKNVEKLLTDDTCRVGILNFQSGGSGFNLQSVAHHIIVYEAIGSPGMIQQAIGRVHRGGQEHPVLVWIFRYAMTMSTKLFNKNFKRADDIRVSLSDETSFVDFIDNSIDLM